MKTLFGRTFSRIDNDRCHINLLYRVLTVLRGGGDGKRKMEEDRVKIEIEKLKEMNRIKDMTIAYQQGVINALQWVIRCQNDCDVNCGRIADYDSRTV